MYLCRSLLLHCPLPVHIHTELLGPHAMAGLGTTWHDGGIVIRFIVAAGMAALTDCCGNASTCAFTQRLPRFV